MLHRAFIASLLVGGALVADRPKATDYPDRPLARSKALEAWFGGLPTAAEMDGRRRLAEAEYRRWERLIPGTAAHRERRGEAALAGGTWINIGPTSGRPQKHGASTDPNVADTGRPTAILPHPTNPKRLYVAFAGGGVWRCDNADLASSEDWLWTPITDALPAGTASGNLSVGGLDFKPEDPNVLYMALGDMEPGSADSTAEGRGFYISKDGGQTWQLGGSLGETTRVRTVMALPGNVILVAGNNGLFRSVDGGSSFVAVPVGTTGLAWTLAKTTLGNLVLSAQNLDENGNPTVGSIWYSTNQGASWAASTLDATVLALAPKRISVTATSGNTVYAILQSKSTEYEIAQGVGKSTDGGATWTFVPSPSLFAGVNGDGGQGSYNQMLAVDPSNPNTLFLGTNLSLWRSQDGGQNWARLSEWMGGGRVYVHADFHVHAWAPSGARALYMGTDGGLAIVRDPERATIPTAGATTYVPSEPTFIDHRRNKGVATHLIYHIGSTNAQVPADSRYRVTIGLQDMGTRLRSGTDLAAATNYDLVVGGDGFGTLIHPHNGDLMLASLYNTEIRRSSNGGRGWSSTSGIPEAGNEDTAPFFTRIFPGLGDPTGNTVYTYAKQKVYASKDFGSTWTPLGTSGFGSSLNLRGLGAAPSDPQILGAVANSGRIYLSRDGGRNWTTTTTLPNVRGYLSWISFDPQNADVIYVASVASGLAFNHLWKSTNGGLTWTAIDGAASGFPAGIPVHCVVPDPVTPGMVYAGTDFGVYQTTNGGTSWARFGSGLPMVSVRDIYVAPDSSFLRIGTHGRGVWEIPPSTTARAPQILLQPRSGSLLEGQRTAFSVTATGSFPMQYQWQKNGVDLPGAQQPYLVETVTKTDDGARFTVRVSNAHGMLTSQSATLTIRTLDLDRSGTLDIFDLGVLVRAMGTAAGQPGFSADLDLNSDGRVDQADLDQFLSAF